MDCTECGRTNRPGAKFCAGCAAPIVAPCSSCGHSLAPDSRFCDQCGTPTGESAATVDPSRDSKTSPTDDAVRKTVTTLFCDLVGSTSLEERVDAESSRDVLGRYHSMVESVIVAGGGTVVKFIGDGAMAVFGIPEVAADDAYRAVAAGLELQRRFLALRTHITGRFEIDVGLRVGINTGEVVIANDDADLVGDSLNVAARLEAACSPGEVLVGEDTWRLTRATVEYESFGVLELRGKEEAVATYRAIDVLAESDDSATPFVGRDEELGRLRAVFDDAVTANSVRLATVTGAPGVGKTRLSRELERALDDEATVVELRCERAGGTTFAPIADLLRSVAEIDDALSNEETVEQLTMLVGELDDAERVASLLTSFVRATPTRSTEELFFAVRRLVEALGRQRPLTVVIDDIQWAEPLFLDLLEHLAEWGQDSPVLLLGLARPELREVRPSLTEVGRRVSESIALEGLDAEATAELAGLLVGTDALPAELLARLPDSTEGNPLFVRELMLMLVDDDVIVETERGWELAIDADAVEVPPTIQSLLSSRIERMPDDERHLVELAAVVGPEFPLGAVAAIGTAGDTATLTATLERLRRKELVEPTGTYWGDEPLFRFHHVLIRDAAYRRLLKGRRADLHLRVAAWIEDVGAGDSGEQQVTIGYHLEQAHDYRTQLDLVDEETVAIGRRAAEMLGAAAERALARDDVAAAGSLAVRAVARLDDEAEERNDLLMLGCEALFSLGDVGAAVPLLKELRGGSDGDARLTAWARAFEAQLVVLTDPERLEEAEAESAAAATELAALDDHAGEANARLVRSSALARLGRIGECEAELDLALGAARAADDGRRVASVLGAAPVAALWGPSPVSRAGGRCLDVIRLLRITTGSPGVEATSTRCQAVLEALRGRFDTARTMLGEALATVEELGLRHGWLETQLYSGIVELLAGDPAAAEPFLRSAYGGLGRLGIGADAGQAAAHLSRALLLQGRLDEADELATDSEALAGQNPQTAIAAKTARAEILAARGEISDALRLAEEAVALAEGTDIVIDHANANVALARVRAAAGDVEGAQSARRAADALFTAKGVTVDLGEIHHLVGSRGVFSSSYLDVNENNDLVEMLEGAHIAQFDAERITRVEPIPADAPDTAFARFAELTNAQPHETEAPEPLNTADAAMRRAFRAGADRDVRAFEELSAHEVVRQDRRRLHGTTQRGAVEIIENLGAFEAGSVVLDIESIAIRGDRVAVHNVRQRSGEDLDGAALHFLHVARSDDEGRIDLAIVLDPDDLETAMAELDRLWDESDEIDHTFTFATLTWSQWEHDANRALQVDFDWTRALTHMDERLQLIDHREIGWPIVDHVGFRDRLESFRQIAASGWCTVPWLHAVNGLLSLGVMQVDIVEPSGAEHLDRNLWLIRASPDSGTSLAMEQFAIDDLPAAMARFGELAREHAENHGLWNVASVAANRSHSWSRLGHPIAGIVLADDIVIEDSHGEPLTSAGLDLDEPDVARRIGIGVEHRRVLAVRGDRLALMELSDEDGDDEPFHKVAVVEIDERCLVARVRLFDVDALADAVRHLGQRWIQVDQPDHPEMLELSIAFQYADATSDSHWYAENHSDDFVFFDHRPIGWGTRDKAWIVEASKSPDGLQGATINPRLLGWNPRGGYAPLVTWNLSVTGELVAGATPSIVVMQVTDGLISRIELLPEDAHDTARTRFEDLTARPTPAIEHEPWNEADTLARRVLQAYARGEVDDAAGDLDAAVRIESRRFAGATHAGTAHKDESLAGLRDRPVFPESTDLELDTIASRGERFVLLRGAYRLVDDSDGPSIEMLILVGLTTHGLADVGIAYETDDLDEAIDELDRLYLEQDPGPELAAALRGWTEVYDVPRTGFSSADGERMMLSLDPNLRMIDHREFGWPEQNFEGFRERIESLVGLDAELSFVIARVRRAEGRLSLVEQVMTVTSHHSAVQTDRNLIISEISSESGLTVRSDQFGADDLDAAEEFFDARARALAALDSIGNTASWLSNRVHSWARAAARERAVGMFADDVVIEHHGGAVLLAGREAVADAESSAGVGFGARDRRVLAIRGEELALMGWRDDDLDGEPFRRFVVVELNRRAEFSHITLFDWTTAGLKGAADHLDERFEAIEELSDLERLGIEFVNAFRHRDRGRLSALIHDDYTSIDNRSIGWGEFDRASWLELFDAPEDVAVVTIVGRLLETTETGFVARMSQWVLADDGLDEALPGQFVGFVREGRIAHTEGFAPDDPQSAIARLAELTGQATAGAEHEPWNEADLLAHRFGHAWARGHPEEAGQDLHPSVRIESRRFAAAAHDGRTGRAEVLSQLANAPVFADPASVTIETIATRGERLVLTRGDYRQLAGSDGPNVVRLVLSRTTVDRRIDLVVVFDGEELDEAIVELDRLYLDDDPDAAAVAVLRVWTQGLDPIMRGEVDAFGDQLDPALRTEDHRHLGWPAGDRSTEIETARSMTDHGETSFVVSRLHRVDGLTNVVELEFSIERPTGAEGTDRRIAVKSWNGASGQTLRVESYGVDDLDAALARADELSRAAWELDPLTNLAAYTMNRVHTLCRADRWELAREWIGNVVIERDDGTRLVDGPDELETADAGMRAGIGVAHRRVLAARGQLLTLMEWRDEQQGGSFQRFALVELDEAARTRRITLFEHEMHSLRRAAEMLDRRADELGQRDEQVPAVVRRFSDAFNRGDVDALAPLLGDDFVAEDMRSLNWPESDRARFLELVGHAQDATLVEFVGGWVAVSAHGAVLRNSEWTTVDGELEEARPLDAIIVERDGKIARSEAHEPDELDSTIARFEELTSESPASETWNEADRLTRRFVGRIAAGDVHGLRADLAEGAVLDDRRRLVQSVQRGRDEVMAFTTPALYRRDQALLAEVETIAVRGDGLALIHCTIRVVDEPDGPTLAWLGIAAWVDDRLTTAVLFDPDAYLDAIDELDRLFLESSDDDVDRMLVRMIGAGYRAICTRDVERVMELGPPSFTMSDHRGIGFGELDSDGFRERIQSIMDLDADLASFVVRLHPSSQYVLMTEGCHRVAHPTGAVQVEQHLGVVSVDPESGLAHRWDFYGTDQFDEAVARYEAITQEIEAAGVCGNVTSLLGNRANAFARLERWDMLVESLAPDVVIEDSAGNRLVTSPVEATDPATAKRLGLGVESRRILAIRAQRLALVELRDPEVDGEPFHQFAVEQTSREHEIVRVALYGPHELAEAADDFDRRWLELDDSGHRETLTLINRNVSAFRHLDVAAAAATMASDFTFVDHRSMGYPALDRDGYLGSLDAVGDAHGIVLGTREGHGRTAGFVSPIVNLSVSPGGELVENQVAVVMIHVHEELVANVEFFPIDDEDAALARLDELAGP